MILKKRKSYAYIMMTSLYEICEGKQNLKKKIKEKSS